VFICGKTASLGWQGEVAKLRGMLAYAVTIFIGAFLLFQVQPLIGKYILPWFGGGPGVWTTWMLFFQALLLGGYAYAPFTSRWLRPRAQTILHLVLLAAALLPITPSDAWKPQGADNPTPAPLLTDRGWPGWLGWAVGCGGWRRWALRCGRRRTSSAVRGFPGRGTSMAC
jgi:hypothetical protein